jgi:transposase
MDTTTLGPHEVATDTRGRRISPRRHRSVEEKRRLVDESLTPGASVAEVARRHGVNANLLFVWRRLEQRGLLETRTRRGNGRRLVPVKLLQAPTTPMPIAASLDRTDCVGAAALRVRFASGIELTVQGAPDAMLLEQLVALLRC